MPSGRSVPAGHQSGLFSADPPSPAAGPPVPARPAPPTGPEAPAPSPTHPAAPGNLPHRRTVPRTCPGFSSPRGGWPQSHNRTPASSA
ncbi:hypothetical protein SI90_08440 [Akkermansia muciniphila]|nr:hypothetical protein [Akkermansia muciniphila]QAR50476.1 hypothetical protein SI90_08440 [Akkermansia muciniphila]